MDLFGVTFYENEQEFIRLFENDVFLGITLYSDLYAYLYKAILMAMKENKGIIYIGDEKANEEDIDEFLFSNVKHKQITIVIPKNNHDKSVYVTNLGNYFNDKYKIKNPSKKQIKELFNKIKIIFNHSFQDELLSTI